MRTEPKSERVYVDTSAYLSILLADPSGRPLVARARRKVICSSALLIVETERNLVRLFREGSLSEQEWSRAQSRFKEDIDGFVIRDVTKDICLSGQFPAVRTPRSNDLVHLRTALWFHKKDAISGFLTLDARQRSAAQEMGLPI